MDSEAGPMDDNDNDILDGLEDNLNNSGAAPTQGGGNDGVVSHS